MDGVYKALEGQCAIKATRGKKQIHSDISAPHQVSVNVRSAPAVEAGLEAFGMLWGAWNFSSSSSKSVLEPWKEEESTVKDTGETKESNRIKALTKLRELIERARETVYVKLGSAETGMSIEKEKLAADREEMVGYQNGKLLNLFKSKPLTDDDKVELDSQMEEWKDLIKESSMHINSYLTLDYATEYLDKVKVKTSAMTFNFAPQTVRDLADMLIDSGITVQQDVLMDMGIRRYAIGIIIDKELGSVRV